MLHTLFEFCMFTHIAEPHVLLAQLLMQRGESDAAHQHACIALEVRLDLCRVGPNQDTASRYPGFINAPYMMAGWLYLYSTF